MTDQPEQIPPVNIQLGADASSFIASLKTAMEKAEAEIQGLDFTAAEQKMDATFRSMATQIVAYANTNNKSLDAMIERLKLYNILQEESATKMRVYMNQAASSAGVLNIKESMADLRKEVEDAITEATSKATGGMQSEFATVSPAELGVINEEMLARVTNSSRIFAETWQLSIAEVFGALKTHFSVLADGLDSVVLKQPGTKLSGDLAKVIPISKEVEAELARIRQLMTNLDEARLMGPVSAMSVFGKSMREAAATAGISVKGKSSEEIFGRTGDANYIALIDKIQNRLQAIEQAYLGIAKAGGLAATKARELTVPEVIDTNKITIIDAKMVQLNETVTETTARINTMQAAIAQTPQADWVPHDTQVINNLQEEVKALTIDLQRLKVAKEQVASTGMSQTSIEEVKRGMTIHPSTLTKPASALQGRALEQVIANQGIADVDAYIKAFEQQTTSKRGKSSDFGSQHGKKMHDEVQKNLGKMMVGAKDEFERGFEFNWGGFNIKGSMDWLDPAKNVIHDFKAIDAGKFAKLQTAIKEGNFSKLPEDLQAYVAQLELYGRYIRQVTGKKPTLELVQLTSRGGIGSQPDQFKSVEAAALRNAKDIQKSIQPAVSWLMGNLIDDATLKDLLKQAQKNLAEAMMMPEVQLKAQVAREAYELQKLEALQQQKLGEAAKEELATQQQITKEEEKQVKAKEEELSAAGAPPTVPPNLPPTTAAPLPEDEGPGAKKWSELSAGLNIQKQYVLSVTQERLLEESLATLLRDKVRQNATLADLKKQLQLIPLQEDLTKDMADQLIEKTQNEIKGVEQSIRLTNTQIEAQKELLNVQRARTKELRAQLDLQSKERVAGARQIDDKEFTKLSELSAKLATISAGATTEDPRTKQIKQATTELEKQLKVVQAMIAQDNNAIVKLKAISDQSAARLEMEKQRLVVLEKEAATLEAQYAMAAAAEGAAQARLMGGTSKATDISAQAAMAQQAVTAQKQLVVATEMKARADKESTDEVQANVTAMRQQVSAAEAIKGAFGKAEKATNDWASKVFSLRHITSSFFGMFLSMIGYGIFGKMQEGLQGMVKESQRADDALLALEGSLEATQRQAAEGVSFKVDVGTTVDDLVGGRQEMLKWVEEFRLKFAGIWSSADIESAAANTLNLTRNLEMTKQQFMDLMELGGVFSIIDMDMQKAGSDIAQGSEYLSRIVQNNIRNTARTAIGVLTPQMQAEKARQLGLQKEWEAYNKLSGAQAANLAMTVNLAILKDKLAGREEEVNKRLGTTAARFKEASAAQEQFGQTSAAAFAATQSQLETSEALSDLLQPKTVEQLVIRGVGRIRSVFEQQVREGRWGELSDEMYEQLMDTLTKRAEEATRKNIFRDIFGSFELPVDRVKDEKVVNKLREDFKAVGFQIGKDLADTIGQALVGTKISLPEIDFPSMVDQLEELDEKRLEQREDALANYFKALRQNGKKYADDLVQFMEDHNDKMVEIADQLREKLIDIGEKRLEDIASANEDLRDKLAEIEKKRAEDTGEDTEKKRDEYLEAEIDHRRKLEDILIDHYRKLKDINDQYLFDLDEAANERNARQALQLMRRNKFDIAKENEAFKQRQEDENRNYAQRLEDIARKQEEENKKKQKDYDKQIADAKEAFEKRLREIEKNTQKEIEEAIKARAKAEEDENRGYEKKKQKRLEQLQEENLQDAQNYKDKVDAIEASIDDELRKIARGWQKKYKLDGEQLKLAYEQLKAYYGPGGYLSSVMEWWRRYVAMVPSFPGQQSTPQPQNPFAPFLQPQFTPIPKVTPIPLSSATPLSTTQKWEGTRRLEIDLTTNGPLTPEFEDRIVEVVTEALHAVRS